jgi:multicomponent Na+:H+ antiporter subunit B
MTLSPLVLAGLLGFVLVTAVVTAAARSTLTAVVAFGAYSLGLAMVWVVFQAPDVALTEAAVGAGVTTALFLLLVARTWQTDAAATDRAGTPADRTTPVRRARRPRLRSLAVAALVSLGLLLTVPSLPPIGAADAPAFGPVTEFYLSDAADRSIDNVVTAVLVVYRGFDTFGEVAVVFAAAVAVLAVLGREVVV